MEPGQTPDFDEYTVVLRGTLHVETKKESFDVRAGQVTRVSESIFSGWLTVFSGIPMKLYVNKQLRGSTDDGQIMLSPGTYDVELVNERFNYRDTRSFTIEPGRVTKYSIELPTTSVFIDSPDGVAITVDGQAAGKTPLDHITVPIGTHEIVGLTPTGERRQSVEVKMGEVMRISFR